MTLPWLRPAWEAPRGVHAAFTLRSGGVSAPPWDSLNLGRHVGDDPRAVAVWSFILTTPASFLLALPFWTWPSANLWPILVALGACAASGQLALSRAFSLADAGAVMPYDFVRFGLITLAGILLFGERYDPLTLVGGAIILAATIVLALREQKIARSRGGRTR
jgi:drug/metabolite transporter (DMT)-like permease